MSAQETFISHLVELRSRLIRSLSAVLLVFVCLFPFAKELYAWLALPLLAALPHGGQMIATDVVGVFLGLKHVLPVMLKRNKGSIINTASIAGLIGSPDIAAYSASKHAVIGLTKSAALECGQTGVRVNCVCPGLIDSRMLSAIIDGRNPGNAPVPTDKIAERIPARRLGQASEVASIVAFLASDEASYVSGSAYTVDGGRTA